MRRSVVVAISFLFLLMLAAGTPAAAQTTLAQATATPEEAATLFLRSVRAIRWRTAAQFLHPSTLARFRELVDILCEPDTTGAMRRYLTGTSDPKAYAALSDATVFERAVGHTIDDLPGLMHSLYDHTDHVLGHVMEGRDTAHVVYRTVEHLSGAVPQVLVMQVQRTPQGWRVLWSDELAVLEEALRGVRRAIKPDTARIGGGPGGPAGSPGEQWRTSDRTQTGGLSDADVRRHTGIVNGREAEPWARGSVERMRRTSP